MHKVIAIDNTTHFWFAANDTDGSGTDGATPAADVRLAGAAAADAPIISPTPVLLTHASYPAGCYEIAIDATVANGFAKDNEYAIFCTLAVGSTNPTGFVGSFNVVAAGDALLDAYEWAPGADVAAYDLPDNVREILAVEYTDTDGDLTKLKEISVGEYIEARIKSDTAGTPTSYVQHGSQLLLYPTPANANEAVKIWAVTEPGDLAAGGDMPPFPPHLHEFILDRALAYAARHMGNLEVAEAYRANVAAALEYEKKQPAAERDGPDRMIPSKF